MRGRIILRTDNAKKKKFNFVAKPRYKLRIITRSNVQLYNWYCKNVRGV